MSAILFPCLQLDTRRSSHTPAALSSGRMNVMLAYLKSYINMGQAEAFCISGCSCEPTRVDGHHTLRQSTIFLARLLPSEARECVIGVKVLESTNSGKHKFKVLCSVVVLGLSFICLVLLSYKCFS